MPHAGLVEVESGVRSGDWVVVKDMQRLKNGKVVIGKRSAEGAEPENDMAEMKKATAKMKEQETFVTYDLPVTQTVTEFERIQGESDAIYTVQVTARVSGYMTEVCFKDGDLVKKNDVLFRIDKRPFKAELDRAEGNLQQLLAHRSRLEREFHRAKNLLDRGSISPEEYTRYESDFRETEAGVRLARADRDLAQLNYDWCDVQAATSGRLSRRMVDPGNLVKADSTALTSIVSLDPIYVYFDVHEQTMLRIKHLLAQGKLKARSMREVPVEISLADEGDDSFPHGGMIDFTDNKVDFTRGTLAFRAKLDNKNHLLTPGLFVRVRLPIGDPHRAIMIPERALVTDHKEKGVYILTDHDENGKPLVDKSTAKKGAGTRRRAVWTRIGNPGVLRDGYVEIEHGVHEGDWVVVSGMQRLRNGKLVKAEKFAPRAGCRWPGRIKPDCTRAQGRPPVSAALRLIVNLLRLSVAR